MNRIQEIEECMDNLHSHDCKLKLVYGDYTEYVWNPIPDIRYLLAELKKRDERIDELVSTIDGMIKP